MIEANGCLFALGPNNMEPFTAKVVDNRGQPKIASWDEVEEHVPTFRKIGVRITPSQEYPNVWVASTNPTVIAFYITWEQAQFIMTKCEGRFSFMGFGEDNLPKQSGHEVLIDIMKGILAPSIAHSLNGKSALYEPFKQAVKSELRLPITYGSVDRDATTQSRSTKAEGGSRSRRKRNREGESS